MDSLYIYACFYIYIHAFLCVVGGKRSVKSQNEILGVDSYLLIWPFHYTGLTLGQPVGGWAAGEGGSLPLLYKSGGTQGAGRGLGNQTKERLFKLLRSRKVKFKPFDGELEPHRP